MQSDPDHTDDLEHHSHAPAVTDRNARKVFWAMTLTGIYMVAEVVGGILSGSLALIADAGHMATDTAALFMAWLAFRLARRPADRARSYGYHRAEILAAFINGLAMLALVGWIVFEAIDRLMTPVEIMGLPMIIVATGGLVINVAAFALLHGGTSENLNIQGAALHVAGDLLGSIAAIAAAGIILWTGWTPIDPILSLLVALLLLRSAWFITRQSAHILMEGTPVNLNLDTLRKDLEAHIGGVEDIHHLHAWSLTQERPIITLHARTKPGADNDAVLRAIDRRLRAHFNIAHATIQIETQGCPPD